MRVAGLSLAGLRALSVLVNRCERAGRAGGLAAGAVWHDGAGGLWPGGELGEAGAAPFAGAGRQAGGGAAGVVGVAGLVGGEDALVADDEQGGEP